MISEANYLGNRVNNYTRCDFFQRNVRLTAMTGEGSVMRTPNELKEVLSRDQLRLYRLIWERFVASQMAPAILDTVTVDLMNSGVQFRANGSHVKFPGFMKLYIEGTDDFVTVLHGAL